jgi:hypothetical protein
MAHLGPQRSPCGDLGGAMTSYIGLHQEVVSVTPSASLCYPVGRLPCSGATLTSAVLEFWPIEIVQPKSGTSLPEQRSLIVDVLRERFFYTSLH